MTPKKMQEEQNHLFVFFVVLMGLFFLLIWPILFGAYMEYADWLGRIF